MTRIYISGAISDPNTPSGLLPGYIEKFKQAEDLLRACGYEPVNPTTLDHSQNTTWAQHMRTDIKALMDCHAVCALPCAGGSKGAKLEMSLAKTLGMPVLMKQLFITGNHAELLRRKSYTIIPPNLNTNPQAA